MMTLEYGENIPKRNLHFIMGNMAKRQWQFVVDWVAALGARSWRARAAGLALF